MKCIYCAFVLKIDRESVYLINGNSTCAKDSHVEAAKTFTNVKHAINWLIGFYHERPRVAS